MRDHAPYPVPSVGVSFIAVQIAKSAHQFKAGSLVWLGRCNVIVYGPTFMPQGNDPSALQAWQIDVETLEEQDVVVPEVGPNFQLPNEGLLNGQRRHNNENSALLTAIVRTRL